MISRCQAPKTADPRGERCDNFVARVPDGYAVAGLVAHSDLAAASSIVVACRRCRFLHEIAPPEAKALQGAA
jgi:hypothetical protein